MHDDIESKLSRARTWLIMENPFLGALVLRIPLVAGEPRWCQTTATDARKIYYNREYIDSLAPAEVQFVLSHEALHCALSHFARREHRDKVRWDVACDYAINPLLLGEGLKAPPKVLYDDSFEGMTAEEIYPYIKENTADQPMDRHLYDSEQPTDSQPQPRPRPPPEGGSEQQPSAQGAHRGEDGGEASTARTPQPPPLTSAERDALEVQWRQRLAGAAQQAMHAGKLSGSLGRMIDHLLQPRLPWRMLLSRYMNAVARDDYSYNRPSRRPGPAILPSLRSLQLDVTVVIDTSGSLADEEIRQFLGEIDAIKGQLRARIALLACDAALAAGAPWIFEPWEALELPGHLHGGGGTRFEPAFEWANSQDQRPDLLLYFTDANGSFPQQAPNYPVLWLVKGKGHVPWGHRVQLN